MKQLPSDSIDKALSPIELGNSSHELSILESDVQSSLLHSRGLQAFSKDRTLNSPLVRTSQEREHSKTPNLNKFRRESKMGLTLKQPTLVKKSPAQNIKLKELSRDRGSTTLSGAILRGISVYSNNSKQISQLQSMINRFHGNPSSSGSLSSSDLMNSPISGSSRARDQKFVKTLEKIRKRKKKRTFISPILGGTIPSDIIDKTLKSDSSLGSHGQSIALDGKSFHYSEEDNQSESKERMRSFRRKRTLTEKRPDGPLFWQVVGSAILDLWKAMVVFLSFITSFEYSIMASFYEDQPTEVQQAFNRRDLVYSVIFLVNLVLQITLDYQEASRSSNSEQEASSQQQAQLDESAIIKPPKQSRCQCFLQAISSCSIWLCVLTLVPLPYILSFNSYLTPREVSAFHLVKVIRLRLGFQLIDSQKVANYMKEKQKARITQLIQEGRTSQNVSKMSQIVLFLKILKTARLIIIILSLSLLTGIIWFIWSATWKQRLALEEDNFIDSNDLDLEQVNPKEMVVRLTYFAFTTLSTVGLGDYHPKNSQERILCAVGMLFGVMVTSFLVESFSLTIKDLRNFNAQHNESEQLNLFFGFLAKYNDNRTIRQEKEVQIKEYFRHRWAQDRNLAVAAQEEQDLFEQLPLRVQASLYTDYLFRPFMKIFTDLFEPKKVLALKKRTLLKVMSLNMNKMNISYFDPEKEVIDELHQGFVLKFLRALEPINFTPGYVFMKDDNRVTEAYFVQEGAIQIGYNYRSRLLKKQLAHQGQQGSVSSRVIDLQVKLMQKEDLPKFLFPVEVPLSQPLGLLEMMNCLPSFQAARIKPESGQQRKVNALFIRYTRWKQLQDEYFSSPKEGQGSTSLEEFKHQVLISFLERIWFPLQKQQQLADEQEGLSSDVALKKNLLSVFMKNPTQKTMKTETKLTTKQYTTAEDAGGWDSAVIDDSNLMSFSGLMDKLKDGSLTQRDHPRKHLNLAILKMQGSKADPKFTIKNLKADLENNLWWLALCLYEVAKAYYEAKEEHLGEIEDYEREVKFFEDEHSKLKYKNKYLKQQNMTLKRQIDSLNVTIRNQKTENSEALKQIFSLKQSLYRTDPIIKKPDDSGRSRGKRIMSMSAQVLSKRKFTSHDYTQHDFESQDNTSEDGDPDQSTPGFDNQGTSRKSFPQDEGSDRQLFKGFDYVRKVSKIDFPSGHRSKKSSNRGGGYPKAPSSLRLKIIQTPPGESDTESESSSSSSEPTSSISTIHEDDVVFALGSGRGSGKSNIRADKPSFRLRDDRESFDANHVLLRSPEEEKEKRKRAQSYQVHLPSDLKKKKPPRLPMPPISPDRLESAKKSLKKKNKKRRKQSAHSTMSKAKKKERLENPEEINSSGTLGAMPKSKKKTILVEESTSPIKNLKIVDDSVSQDGLSHHLHYKAMDTQHKLLTPEVLPATLQNNSDAFREAISVKYPREQAQESEYISEDLSHFDRMRSISEKETIQEDIEASECGSRHSKRSFVSKVSKMSLLSAASRAGKSAKRQYSKAYSRHLAKQNSKISNTSSMASQISKMSLKKVQRDRGASFEETIEEEIEVNEDVSSSSSNSRRQQRRDRHSSTFKIAQKKSTKDKDASASSEDPESASGRDDRTPERSQEIVDIVEEESQDSEQNEPNRPEEDEQDEEEIKVVIEQQQDSSVNEPNTADSQARPMSPLNPSSFLPQTSPGLRSPEQKEFPTDFEESDLEGAMETIPATENRLIKERTKKH